MGRHFASLLQQETDLLNLILVGLSASDNVPKLVGHETHQKMTVFGTQIGPARARPLPGGMVVP